MKQLVMRSLHNLLAMTMLVSASLSAAPRVSVGLPQVGDTYVDVLRLAPKQLIPLPPGQWLVNHVFDEAAPANRGVVVLLNSDLQSPLKLFVARYEKLPGRWTPTDCEKRLTPGAFGHSVHGLSQSSLHVRCSQVFQVGRFRYTLNERWRENSLWGPIISKLTPAIVEKMPDEVALMESQVGTFNQLRIYVYLFADIAAMGEKLGVFKQNLEANTPSDWAKRWLAWREQYVETVAQAYVEGKSDGKVPAHLAAAAAAWAMVASVAQKPEPKPVALAQTDRAGTPSVVPPTTIAAKPMEPKITSASPALSPVAAPATVSRESLELAKVNAEMAALRKQLQLIQAQTQAQSQAQTAAPVAAPTPAAYANRRALVMGNDAYQSVSKLLNARADARAMGGALEKAGFKVTIKLDLTERGMKEAIRNFKAETHGGDEVVIFFAGHGVQLGASNYLLPVDIRGESEDQVKDEAIPLQRMLDDIQDSKAKFTLVVIDACRDNPFKTAGRALGGRGLAPTTAATGQMVIFSAGNGQQALDRLGDKDKDPNGLFTRVFLKEMQKPSAPIDRVLRSVRSEVVRLSKSVGHEQVPSLYDQALGDFYFIP